MDVTRLSAWTESADATELAAAVAACAAGDVFVTDFDARATERVRCTVISRTQCRHKRHAVEREEERGIEVDEDEPKAEVSDTSEAGCEIRSARAASARCWQGWQCDAVYLLDAARSCVVVVGSTACCLSFMKRFRSVCLRMVLLVIVVAHTRHSLPLHLCPDLAVLPAAACRLSSSLHMRVRHVTKVTAPGVPLQLVHPESMQPIMTLRAWQRHKNTRKCAVRMCRRHNQNRQCLSHVNALQQLRSNSIPQLYARTMAPLTALRTAKPKDARCSRERSNSTQTVQSDGAGRSRDASVLTAGPQTPATLSTLHC